MALPTTIRPWFAALMFACAASAQVTWYSVSLDSEQQVPSNGSTGGGYGIVRLEEPANTVRIFTDYFGLTGAPTAAHMHQGAAGSNGGVALVLGHGAAGTFTGTGGLGAAQVLSLKTAGMYLNIHTAAFGGGEIRGQIVLPTSTRFTAILNGGQAVPPHVSFASGIATAFLHEPDHRLVYDVDSTGLANVAAAHLHGPAAAGVNGPVVFALNGIASTFCGVSPRLTAAQVAALLADTTYLNIHTAAFANGEIRGQLQRDPGTHFVASMNGANEVPPNASLGLGAASLILSPTGTATITVSYGGLMGASTVSHIHTGPVGVAGPQTVMLTPSGGQFVATFTPTPLQMVDLRTGNWYVNVHSTAVTAGEIRGQIRPAVLPTTFGPTCLGTAGRPESGAVRFPGIGASVDIDLYGALPGGVAFLMIGLNRDVAVPGPLPLAFTAVGLNAPCFFLLDPVATLLQFANPMGCAKLVWNVPFNPAVRGVFVVTQWVLLDAAANAAGLVASNGLQLLLQ